MVIPLENERTWLDRLSGLPVWRPPTVPTLVISPHPDDETLGCGGLIVALRGLGVDVHVVAVTDGEHAYPDEHDLGAKREQEQIQALRKLSVSADRVSRLRLVDSGVTEQAVLEGLLPLVQAGMHIITPWELDFHPDHEACGRAAAAVAKQKGCRLTSYFFWTWHRGLVGLMDGLEVRRFPLSEDQLHAKAEALLCHESQLQHASGEPILPKYLLGPMERPFEVYLPHE